MGVSQVGVGIESFLEDLRGTLAVAAVVHFIETLSAVVELPATVAVVCRRHPAHVALYRREAHRTRTRTFASGRGGKDGRVDESNGTVSITKLGRKRLCKIH